MPDRRSKSQIHVALLAPEIHWNTGNIGRTCLAAGARLHLIEPLGFSLEARELRRAGLDYWPHVMPCLWPAWEDFERHLPELGEPYFFSAEASRSFWEPTYREETVLIFGCESVGLPANLRQRFRERLLAIPQDSRRVRSLNLSSSVGIAVYEVVRQRTASRS
jgi:tRNA (cytidine/uridine-2'-O-)-methyltransferase